MNDLVRADELRILYVGMAGGVCGMRAEALRSLGHHLVTVPAEVPRGYWRFQLYRVGSRLGRPPDVLGANRAILRAASRRMFDLLWVDKGRSIRPATLARVRALHPQSVLVTYSPDDMMNPDNQTAAYLSSIPQYDLHVTTKSYNVPELTERGARDAMFVDNAYDPATHRPLPLSAEEKQRYEAEVGFIGGFEEERAREMAHLAENGVPVTVRGYQWDQLPDRPSALRVVNRRVDGDEYAKAICGTKINLGFLRKINRDLQTTRSIEIPACGAFLLAERTEEHLGLFKEGEEAEFFSTREELLQKCRYYLEHDEKRERIAGAGRARCVGDDYSNAGRLRQVLNRLQPLLQQRVRSRPGTS